jgi:hypothetical protein
MRVCLAVVTLVSVWAACASDALAIRIRTATFSASLAGTYTTSAEVTESQCGGADPDGNPQNLPPVKGTVTDRTTFSSARRTKLSTEFIDSPPLFAGGHLSIRVRVTRTGGLTSSGHVRGCRPGFDASDPPTSCGTRTHTYPGAYLGANHGTGLGFAFLRQGRFVTFPADIFGDACQLGPGQVWFGRLSVLTTPVSTTKLFNRHKHTVTVVGRRSGRSSTHEGDLAASVTFSERFTLTLRRIG